MSLLVPEYASSSEDESCSTVSVSTSLSTTASHPNPLIISKDALSSSASDTAKTNLKKTKKKKKPKTILYLPPEIQRLLERGTSNDAILDDSDSDDDELLSKHKHARKAVNKRPRIPIAEKNSILSFLPPPKHEVSVNSCDSILIKKKDEGKSEKTKEAETNHESVDENASHAAAWQQSYLQQQQYDTSTGATSLDYNCVAQGEEDVPGDSSKRKRTREREIERALQQGHFEILADQITEVRGPIPNAWQPPDGMDGTRSEEVKVNASFWNAKVGANVSSIKPTRMQRQKHQLNQLAFDAKVRDFELLEKRGAALKTKRETYAKYGW